MDYDAFIELFTDQLKRTKARVYAIVFCLPLWILGTIYLNGFQRSDAVWTIILIALAVLYCDKALRLSFQIKKTERLKCDNLVISLKRKMKKND